jgi:aspartate racemase
VSKVVGVIGGMGPAATLDFQARLLAATPASRDQDHLRVIVDCNPRLPDRNLALAGEGPSPGPALAAMARGLELAGAEVLVMPCNTAHAFADDIRAAVAIPFLCLVEATADAAAAKAAPGAMVGVLAVDGCRRAGLYEAALAARGLDPVGLEAADQAAFMRLIYAIKAGDTGPDVGAGMARLAGALRDAGATVVIAACTEIPLVLDPSGLGVPLIDSAAVLVDRTLACALGA